MEGLSFSFEQCKFQILMYGIKIQDKWGKSMTTESSSQVSSEQK